ncbi:hypothetical protein VTL71DRAFT_8996 [Oculimacula yallundae]|uniref:AB hydrolase-1 domain-containing protein n=1 Tax=Oculimacula yallundae TaxID=86028 RepID=A0ABR4BTG6_9HELO
MPFKTINSTPLFYTSTPSTTPSPLTTLFVHGLGSSSCFYASIIPSLSAQTYCIALDTPGSGLSTLGRKGAEQTIETIADDALALLEALNVTENVVLVGHSMGGIVASVLAERMGQRCKGVVLLGPVDPKESLRGVFEKRVEVVKADGLEPLANTIPTGATGTKSTALHHAFIRSLILGTSPDGYISLCNAIANAKRPGYIKVQVPLLILAGEDDKTAPLESAKVIASEYGTEDGKKEVKVLKRVGHWHCVEASEEVAKFVGEFLTSL